MDSKYSKVCCTPGIPFESINFLSRNPTIQVFGSLGAANSHDPRKLETCRYIANFKNICDSLAMIGEPVDDQAHVFFLLLQGLGDGYEFSLTKSCKSSIPLLGAANSHDPRKPLTCRYIANFKNICDSHAMIGEPVDDQAHVFWLLQGLGDGYEAFVTAMLKSPIPSFHDIFPLLQSFEDRLKLPSESTPFVAMFNQCGGGGGRRGRVGNTYESRGRKFSKAKTLKTRIFRPPNHLKIIPRITRSQSYVKSVEKNHSAIKCYKRFNRAYQSKEAEKALAAMIVVDNQDTEWSAESGVSEHYDR